MIIVTSEYIFMNRKLNEINDLLKNARLENDRKYGDNYCRKIKVIYNCKFFDKIKNKTKNITIKHYHLHGLNKTMIASQGRYEIIRPNKLNFLIE